MISFLRISILEEMRAVIVGEAIGVRWKMRGDPVESERIALLHRIPKMGFRFDMILVEGAPRRTSDEPFPDSRIVLSESERVLARPPLVEISNNRDMFRIWCPHRKMGSILSIELGGMGAEFFVEFEVFSFFEEIDVVRRQ